MVDEAVTSKIGETLFPDPKSNVFAILDGASAGRPLQVMLHEHRPERQCLFRGDLAPDMLEVAPWLVELKREHPFTKWLLSAGWGNHWGIFALSPATLLEMRGHFSALVDVYDPDGKPLILRYYDPRVLPVFLPTCTADDLAEVFGPVSGFMAEGEAPGTLLSFRMEEGELRAQELRLAGPEG